MAECVLCLEMCLQILEKVWEAFEVSFFLTVCWGGGDCTSLAVEKFSMNTWETIIKLGAGSSVKPGIHLVLLNHENINQSF